MSSSKILAARSLLPLFRLTLGTHSPACHIAESRHVADMAAVFTVCLCTANSGLGEHDLKGMAEPVHAWRVERVAVTDSRFDAHHTATGLTPLVGREGEVDLLLHRWSQAQDGEGQVVLLGGEPGIGKSRILSVLRERLEAKGVQALRLQCSPYYVNSAFWPIIDNFERALRFTRDEAAEVKLNK